MSTVRVARPAVVTVNGMVISLREDEAYDSQDDVVRAHPWAFRSDIEEATAGPGERRNVRRP